MTLIDPSLIKTPAGYTLRPINFGREDEVDLVVARSMQTILDTIPEFEGDSVKARQKVKNFTHEEMKAMYVKDHLTRSATHRFLGAVAATGDLVGHIIFFVRDTEATKMGYIFTLYVAPEHRNRGVARALAAEAVRWLKERGAMLVVAHTHATNAIPIALAAGHGFQVGERVEQPWAQVKLEGQLM